MLSYKADHQREKYIEKQNMVLSVQVIRDSGMENRDFHRECPNNPVFS